MPRYIDADLLTEMIQAKADTLIMGKEAFLCVAKWLDYLPSADVASRAEVAREIFEEIDVTWSERGCVSEFFENIAELKKKYIGEQNDERN
jgi:hypothetical protein